MKPKRWIIKSCSYVDRMYDDYRLIYELYDMKNNYDENGNQIAGEGTGKEDCSRKVLDYSIDISPWEALQDHGEPAWRETMPDEVKAEERAIAEGEKVFSEMVMEYITAHRDESDRFDETIDFP